MTEILLQEDERTTIFPIKYPEIWSMYKKALSCIWTVEELDLTKDLKDWEKLSENERYFIKQVLAFFGSSDTIVNINISERFVNEIKPLEAKFFYTFQQSIENIHSETYSILIDTYIKESSEKTKMFNALKEYPFIHAKAQWCMDWINDLDAPFSQRLIAFAIVEGIFFSGAFCSIFWLKEKGKMPGLCFSNELISRDEGMHVEFAVLLYSMIFNKIEKSTVYEMFRKAVKIEKEFICDAIPCALLGMNSKAMSEYIEFVSDRLLLQLGYPKMYNTQNPFPFMDRISIENKTNFFEARVAEYSKANVGLDNKDIYDFSIDEDF